MALVGLVVVSHSRPLAEADAREGSFSPRHALLLRYTRVYQRQHHVLERGIPRQQIERLKNETDFTVTDIGKLIILHLAYVRAIENVTPPARGVETT